MLDPYTIIKRPIITERTNLLRAQNKYVFEVARHANKHTIKRAIELLFSVKVIDVNTLIQHGKKKRVRYIEGRRPDFKKAIVTLKEGDTLPFFEG